MPRSPFHRVLKGLLLLALMTLPQATAHAESPAALISTFRLANGESKVTLDPTLTAIARAQADTMAAKAVMDHDVLGAFSSRIAPAKAGRAAENIAYGYEDFPRTLNQWINSPGHRKNLLLKDAAKVGVASARSAVNQRTYWAMVIAGGYDKPPAREPKIAAKAAAKTAAAARTAKTRPSKSKPAAACRISLLGLCL